MVARKSIWILALAVGIAAALWFAHSMQDASVAVSARPNADATATADPRSAPMLADVRDDALVESKAGQEVRNGDDAPTARETSPQVAVDDPNEHLPRGAIQGSVVVPEGYPVESLIVRATSLRAAPTNRFGAVIRETHLLGGARFVVRELSPGPWQVDVLGKSGHALATIDSIEVRSGDPVVDPRLESLELALRTIWIQPVDVNGTPVKNADVGLPPHTFEGAFPITAQVGDRVRCILEDFDAPLWLRAPGFHGALIAHPSITERVVLTRMGRLTVRAAGVAELRHAPYQLQIDVSRRPTDDPEPTSFTQLRFRDDRTSSTSLTGTGRYEFRARLTRGGSSARVFPRRPSKVHGALLATLIVDDDTIDQEVSLPIADDLLANLIADAEHE